MLHWLAKVRWRIESRLCGRFGWTCTDCRRNCRRALDDFERLFADDPETR